MSFLKESLPDDWQSECLGFIKQRTEIGLICFMVFKRLFGRSSQQPVPSWSVTSGQRFYAIGDIHGRLDLLDLLLAKIDADDAARGATETHLIFLGDLVDRGPDSCGVVNRVIELIATRPHVQCLGGNHEDILLTCYEGDTKAIPLFDRVGGRETMISYGMSAEEYDQLNSHQLTTRIGELLPKAHVSFLRKLEDFVLAGNCLFVHAGLKPGRALEDQRRTDMRWIRDEFTGWAGSHAYLVIHGHTITEQVDEQANRIGIDTGAYATGRLTAIGLEGHDRWFIATGE